MRPIIVNPPVCVANPVVGMVFVKPLRAKALVDVRIADVEMVFVNPAWVKRVVIVRIVPVPPWSIAWEHSANNVAVTAFATRTRRRIA